MGDRFRLVELQLGEKIEMNVSGNAPPTWLRNSFIYSFDGSRGRGSGPSLPKKNDFHPYRKKHPALCRVSKGSYPFYAKVGTSSLASVFRWTA